MVFGFVTRLDPKVERVGQGVESQPDIRVERETVADVERVLERRKPPGVFEADVTDGLAKTGHWAASVR